MSVEQNKATVRRFISEVFEKGSFESVDELVSPEFVPHSWPSVKPGTESLKQAMKRVFSGVAQPTMKIEDMIAEGDRVAVRLTAQATQKGEFMGIPGTGRKYSISETHIFRIKDGKIVEHWRDADMLGMMQQLGALDKMAHAS
jgi:steroid delta-isomerase-like uncharacterized protein